MVSVILAEVLKDAELPAVAATVVAAFGRAVCGGRGGGAMVGLRAAVAGDTELPRGWGGGANRAGGGGGRDILIWWYVVPDERSRRYFFFLGQF